MQRHAALVCLMGMSLLMASAARGGEPPPVVANVALQPLAVQAIQAALDPLCLLAVDINPEARVKVAAGPAAAELTEAGWRTFLVKVHNAAGVTAELKVFSDQAKPLANSESDKINDRWLDLSLFSGRPLSGPKLSGLELEYRIIQLYSRDAGKRSAKIAFNVGQGTQDIGFRNDVDLLFTAQPTS